MSAPTAARKSRWEDLAIFGGDPAFDPPLHVGKPNLPDRRVFDAMVDQIWESQILTNNGPFVQKLEDRFCAEAGARHAVAVCNATLGLQLVARALELEGEIVMPAFTFVATAHSFRWEGLRPVFCDVCPEHHTLDPKRAAQHVTEDTVAIAGVHLWGNCSASVELEKVAKTNGLHLIFDAAHAIGGAAPTIMGDAHVYSLHATKLAHGFEGGVVVTNSDLLAHRLRALRNFGFAGYDDVRALGTNAKMSEIAAAMALCSLDSIGDTIDANRRNDRHYREVCEELSGIRIYAPKCAESANHQYVVAHIDETAFGIGRDALMAALWAEGVRARRYFYPGVHWSEPYRWENPDAPEHLPVTERLCREVLVFPTGPNVSSDDIEIVGTILQVAQAASRRIAETDLAEAA